MTKFYEVLFILTGGAVGGLASVIDAWQEPIAFPLTLAKFAALVAIPILKGGLAAGIGVYLLTTVDPAQIIRTFFFAVTCGLTFPAILTNGASQAQRATAAVATTQVSRNVEKLTAVASAQPAGASAPDVAASSVAVIRSASLEIIQAAPKATTSEAKAGDTAVQQAVNNLANAPNTASDPAAVDAITHIGAAAAGQNLSLTRDFALRSLKTLENAPSTTSSVRERAAVGISQIERVNAQPPQ